MGSGLFTFTAALSAVSGYCLFFSPDAGAFTMRRAGLACRVEQPSGGVDAYQLGYLQIGQQLGATTRAPADCSVENNSTNPSNTYANIDVYVRDTSSSYNFSAWTCKRDVAGFTQYCSPSTSNSGTGFKTLLVSNLGWNSSGDYPYIHIEAPQDSFDNEILGYRIY